VESPQASNSLLGGGIEDEEARPSRVALCTLKNARRLQSAMARSRDGRLQGRSDGPDRAVGSRVLMPFDHPVT